MKRLFISGPIRKGNLAANIQKACDVGYAFAKLGYCPFVPHLSCYFDGPDRSLEHRRDGTFYGNSSAVTPKAENRLNHAEWIRIDLAWVEVADVVIRILGDSEGADKEVLHAEQHGLPVFFVSDVRDVEGVHKIIQSWEKS